MVAIGLLIMYFGYGQVFYGWTLLKGWDISWREAMSPINPYQWPGKGDPPAIPAGQVLPGGAGQNPLGVAGPAPAAQSGTIGVRGTAQAAGTGLRQGLFGITP